MLDREKVIYSIERCVCHVPDACHGCAYAKNPYNICWEMLLWDARELLKRQEPVKAVRRVEETEWNVCGNCGSHIISKWKWCPYCGQAVKWND